MVKWMKSHILGFLKIKKYERSMKIRTAIREEPVKLAQYLRGEKEKYELFHLGDLNA